MTEASNPGERSRWNDERWTSVWPKRERFTDPVTPCLLNAAALAPGERALDIGCGGGKTSIEAARLVGPQGSVVGADISTALGDLARRRAKEAGVDNVRFELVDMQHDEVAGGPFDIAMSQFGVMFFDEPTTAFTNIAHHLRARGRIVFACWQPADRNPWFAGAAVARFLSPAPPAEGKSPAGPFTLGDVERTTDVLRAAGFSTIRHTPIDFDVEVPEDAIVDDDQLTFMGVAGSDMAAARKAIDEHMSQFRLGPGRSRFPLSFLIFEAQRA